MCVISIFLDAERFIAEALDSVLSQDFGDLQIVLVDDGSAEACASLAREYARRYHPFVLYVDHDRHQNRGMSASRNLGLAHADSEFVAFIDADDVWAPGKLREQVSIMNAHPELGLVCGTVQYWSSWDGGEDHLIPTGHRQDQIVRPPEASLALYPLGTAAAPCPSDLLLRREIVSRVGGFEEHFTGPLQLYEDQAFLAKIYLEVPVYFSSRVWLKYRQHSDSCVSQVKSSGRYDEVRKYFLHWFEGYLATRTIRTPQVDVAVQGALFQYRHPHVHKASGLVRRIWDGHGRIASRAVKHLLGRS